MDAQVAFGGDPFGTFAQCDLVQDLALRTRKRRFHVRTAPFQQEVAHLTAQKAFAPQSGLERRCDLLLRTPLQHNAEGIPQPDDTLQHGVAERIGEKEPPAARKTLPEDHHLVDPSEIEERIVENHQRLIGKHQFAHQLPFVGHRPDRGDPGIGREKVNQTGAGDRLIVGQQ